MPTRRLLKAAEAIREVVSMAILTELRDPRIQDVTVTSVEVAPDMRSAKVHVSVMGSEAKQSLSLRGLQNAAGFLQRRIADRIDTRYTPRLSFAIDKGVKNSIEVSRLLDQLLPRSEPAAEALTDDVETDEAVEDIAADEDIEATDALEATEGEPG